MTTTSLILPSQSDQDSECNKFHGRLKQICTGEANLPLDKLNAYRKRWGLSPLESLPSRLIQRAEESLPVKRSGCGGCNKGKSKPLPSTLRQAGNLAKALIKHKLDGSVKLNSDQINARLSICNQCEWFRPEDDRCASCGCFVKEKATWRSEDCPVGNWKTFNWAYGVTTVPERLNRLLPQTLEALRDAGFGSPHLFVDGATDVLPYATFGLEVTARNSNIKTFGNWALALNELYIRSPHADRYAIFQDDFVACRNLMGYLNHTTSQPKSYWNLFTFPSNQKLARGKIGWYHSNQKGLGAVGLVFPKEAVVDLLSESYWINKPQQAKDPHRLVDHAIAISLANKGYQELVHNPSLLQHVGSRTTMGSPKMPLQSSFRGQSFDAIDLLKGELK